MNTATAAARCFGSLNMVPISARPDGASDAPATPMRARAAMSMPGLVDKAASTELAPNAAAPASSTLRRPIRSPRVPMVTRNPAIMNP